MTIYHIMASVLSPIFVRERYTKKKKNNKTKPNKYPFIYLFTSDENFTTTPHALTVSRS